MELCLMCNTNKIEMKKRPLCLSCYRTCLKDDMLFLFPITDASEKTRTGIMEKYGLKLLDEIENLRLGKTTLKSVGDKFGLTRERIRQIYFRICNVPYGDVVSKRKTHRQEKYNTERSVRFQIENKLKRIKMDSNQFKGTMAEFIFYKKCDSHGYNVSLRGFGKHIYDADVNGLRVEIKSSYKYRKISIQNQQTYYHVRIKKKQLDIIDFLAIYIAPEDFWYILPRNEIGEGESVFIPFDPKPGNGKHQHLQQYRNAWHLLKKEGI